MLKLRIELVLEALEAGIGRVAHEHRLAGLVPLGIADHAVEKVLLVEGIEGGLADLGVVERLEELVEAEDVLVAPLVEVDQLDVLVGLQDLEEVVLRIFDHVDLALEQCVHDRLLIGHRHPFDAIDLGDLAAGQARRRLAARLVLGILDVDRLLAGLPFVLHEEEGTGAGRILDLLEGIGLGDALGHDEGVARGLAQRLQHDAGRRLEQDLEGLGIDRLHVIDLGPQHLAQRIAHRPALERGHDVLGRDRRAVMEFQPVAQGEGPGELVVGGRPLVDHLRLDLEIAVQREQRVVDQVAVVAHDVRGGPDRIDDLQVGVIDDPQRRLRLRGARPNSVRTLQRDQVYACSLSASLISSRCSRRSSPAIRGCR